MPFEADPTKQNTVLLLGEGRSGTTWVSSIINFRNEFKYLFEPFHPAFIETFKNYNYYQYLRPDRIAPDILSAVADTFQGRIEHEWVDKLNTQASTSQILVKDIFCQLFLKWIQIYFPEIKIIFLLRHPFAIATSKAKLTGWPGDPQIFLEDKVLVENFLSPFEEDLRAENSLFEKQILIWSVVNYIPLTQFEKGQIHLAFYEEFCVNPEQEIKRLFSFLGEDIDEKDIPALFGKILKQPSATTLEDSPINTGEDLVNAWKKKVTDKSQIDKAMKILNRFGLGKIYTEDAMPNIAEAYKFLEETKDKNQYDAKLIETQKKFKEVLSIKAKWADENAKAVQKQSESEVLELKAQVKILQAEVADNKFMIGQLRQEIENYGAEYQKVKEWALGMQAQLLAQSQDLKAKQPNKKR